MPRPKHAPAPGAKPRRPAAPRPALDIFEVIERDLERRTVDRARRPDPKEPLRDFVARLGRELERHVAPTLLGGHPHEVRTSVLRALGDARDALDRRLCTECLAECPPHDDCDAVDREPFSAVFRIAVEAARAYYGTYSTLLPRPVPRFAYTVAIRDRPSDIVVDGEKVSVRGETRFSSEADPATGIRLLFSHEEFRAKDPLIVPMILFHECVCHAFQSFVPDPLARRHTGPDDAFAEGWMDRIALRVLGQVVRGTGPCAGLGKALGRAALKLDYARRFHAARKQANPRGPRARYAGFLTMGATAAERLGWLLSLVPALEHDADRLLFRISFDLNADGRIPDRDKERFAKACFRRIKEPSWTGHVPIDQVLVQALVDYASTNDLRRLVSAVT